MSKVAKANGVWCFVDERTGQRWPMTETEIALHKRMRREEAIEIAWSIVAIPLLLALIWLGLKLTPDTEYYDSEVEAARIEAESHAAGDAQAAREWEVAQ